MEITTTTMGMVGTMGVPTRDFRHAALKSMTEREARGHKAAIGMTWNDYKALLVEEFCPRLTPEIRGILNATQPTTIHNAILRAGILIDEAISCGTLSKSNEKRKAVEEDAKSRGSWRD
ncbi:hypothetical protein Tco_1558261 [Tanacetum coccineum]